jgi:hypothetical protein
MEGCPKNLEPEGGGDGVETRRWTEEEERGPNRINGKRERWLVLGPYVFPDDEMGGAREGDVFQTLVGCRAVGTSRRWMVMGHDRV